MATMNPSTYIEVMIALNDELSLPKDKQSEAVIQVCRSWLEMFKPPLWTEISLGQQSM